MKNKIIIIIGCESTHVNLIEDIKELGYEPIVYEPLLTAKVDKDELTNPIYGLDAKYHIFGIEKPIVVNLNSQYDEILDFTRSLKPAFIIPAGDATVSIYLATKLANDLKLPANQFSIFKNMKNKNSQQLALKKAKLRYIKSYLIYDLKQALKVYKTLGNKMAVVKPNEDSGGSNNVFICCNKNEFIKGVKQNLDIVSKNKGVLVQEFVNGVEWVVNIVVSKGNMIVSSAMSYKKVMIPGYTKVYDVTSFISPSTKGLEKVVNYAKKVVKALGIQYGTVHSEFMVDKNGPVLIEANCRVTGPSLKKSYLEKCLPHHETNLLLKSFVDPQYFKKNKGKIFEPKAYSAQKYIIVPKNCFVIKNKLYSTLKKLKSYVYSLNSGDNKIYPKTIDLMTCGGIIYLAHTSKKQLDKDLAYIRDLERNHFDKLFDYTLTKVN